MAVLVLPEQLDVLAEIIPEREVQGALPSAPLLSGPTESVAVELLPTSPNPPPAGIDDDLVNLIAACMSVYPEHRPRLHLLEDYVRQAVRDRNQAFYQNLNDEENVRRAVGGLGPESRYDVARETDDSMREMVDRILFDAPT
ncbi:hypothetical protein GGR58DRAFT_67747 [Xylaria digitata]|nr:hypothetical protein GGR58DRAFT_67747 [Xylaria digitata]